jgi:hypothetical protein
MLDFDSGIPVETVHGPQEAAEISSLSGIKSTGLKFHRDLTDSGIITYLDGPLARSLRLDLCPAQMILR